MRDLELLPGRLQARRASRAAAAQQLLAAPRSYPLADHPRKHIPHLIQRADRQTPVHIGADASHSSCDMFR